MSTGDHVVGALDDDERGSGQLRQSLGAGQRLATVLRPMHEEHRADDRAADRLHLRLIEVEVGVSVGDHRVHGAVEGPVGRRPRSPWSNGVRT
jgi:hypothetical protein